MPMYWTFNCFLGCIYTVYYIVHIVFLVLNWLSNLEFRLPKKEDQVARIGVMGGGGFRWFGQCPKENVFFPLIFSLTTYQCIKFGHPTAHLWPTFFAATEKDYIQLESWLTYHSDLKITNIWIFSSFYELCFKVAVIGIES